MSGRSFAARRARAVGEKSARATLKLEIQSRMRRRTGSGRKNAAIDPSRFGLMMIAWSSGLRGSPPAFASWCSVGSKLASTPANWNIWRKNALRIGAIILVEEDLDLLRREMGLKPPDLLGDSAGSRCTGTAAANGREDAPARRRAPRRSCPAARSSSPGHIEMREGLLDRVPQDRDELGIGQAGADALGRFGRVEIERRDIADDGVAWRVGE